MATKTINDYTAAVSIDATNDYFLLEQSGVYVRINRSIMLGITGSPVGTSDTQVLTNKTIGNTNAVTLKTNGFTLQDASDATKQLALSLSGITTGTTRTLTVPNASATLATLTGVEVFTNKTLTSPVISSGTIDNATITVDSIAGHTSSTVISVAGLQISSGVLNTANAVTATSIAAGAVQPQALQSGTGSGWSWTANTPTLTNIAIGTGGGALNSARFIQMGKTVFMHGKIVLGSAGASVSGAITIALPVTSVAVPIGIGPIGQATLVQSGVTQFTAVVYWTSTTTAVLVPINAASTYATTATSTSSTVPWSWTAGDGLEYDLHYEAA